MAGKIKKYNIILITIDGARYERIKNFKNFQRLVNKSTLFSQMITYAPYTLASLHAIFTGSYGSRNGVDSFYSSPNFRKKLFPTLASYLKSKGYYTIAD
ncbi:MAG: sulfatase-like hydrolase/transferase, partial [Candidatus Pacearchaeota archaeon]|nr:sulfatase-like hydrolase/transferase [Candidatus Pacearchaeota archaeon]